MRQNHLASAVEKFRCVWKNEITNDHNEILDHLLSSPDAKIEWSKFFRNIEPETDFANLIHRAFVIKTRSDLNGTLIGRHNESKKKNWAVIEAATALEDFFCEVPIIIPGERAANHASALEINEDSDAFLKSLSWAKAYVAGLMLINDVAVQNEYPRSRKRGSPYLNFAVMLCAEMKWKFAKKGYPMVTALTRSFYAREVGALPDGGINLQKSIEAASAAEDKRCPDSPTLAACPSAQS